MIKNVLALSVPNISLRNLGTIVVGLRISVQSVHMHGEQLKGRPVMLEGEGFLAEVGQYQDGFSRQG